MKYSRRDFIKASAIVGAAAGISELAALPSGAAAAGESPHMETFTEWLQADRDTRKRGLELCLQRIRELDPSIHAWVQVQPERPTADGPLSEIPFGAKDIIETQGMATEYGSPPYKRPLCSPDPAVLRPASYCGVTGFKPTYDLLPTEGMLPVSKSLDTLGLFTHTPADMLALWKALGHPTGSEEQFAFGSPEPIPDCEPEMANAFRQALSLLRRSGVRISTLDISDMLKKLDEANDVEMFYEGARFHEARLKEFGDRLDQPLANLVRDGLKIPATRYDQARRFLAESRVRFAEIFKSTPSILTPAATAPAPLGLWQPTRPI